MLAIITSTIVFILFIDAIGNKNINESIDFPIRLFFFNLSERFAFFSGECITPWSGFLSWGTIGIWGQIILCPVLCRMFSSISGFYPLDASNTSSLWFVTNTNDFRHCQISLRSGEGWELPWMEIHWPRFFICLLVIRPYLPSVSVL